MTETPLTNPGSQEYEEPIGPRAATLTLLTAALWGATPVAVKGSVIVPGTPVVLFPTKILFGGVDRATRKQYDVAPNSRFLINVALDDATVSPITIVQNWGGLRSRQ